MLSIEDNEKITRTGPGTPMGNLFRRFWLPVLLSSELAERDGPPVRVKLLSEQLIAFRNSEGRIGLLEERCPHRHASLYWGRNEESGIRCVYHGWKFTVDGSCVDQPAEPANSRFKEHVCAIAYATHEVGGIIWGYLGHRDKQPPFPEFEFTLLPESHYGHLKRLQQCNWLQNLEGELDTSHSNFLHRSWKEGESFMAPDEVRRKRYLIAETDFGLLCIARSDAGPDQFYWRVTPFQVPMHTISPKEHDVVRTWHTAVPIDDENCFSFSVSWHPERPLKEREADASLAMDVDPKTFLPAANKSNDYLRDLDKMRHGSWTGIGSIKLQDTAVQEDQDGPIMRRYEEHLGVTDRAIVGARRLLLSLADDLERGIEPPQLEHPEAFRLRSLAFWCPRDVEPIPIWLAEQAAPIEGIGALQQ